MKHLGTLKLETERLVLRRIEENDAKEIYDGFINQEDYLYFFNKEPRTLDEEIKSLEGINEKYEDLDLYNWVIVLKEKNAIIGRATLNVELYNECVEINYCIDKRYENNGYMTEALRKIIDFCLNELEVNRFQAGCVVENVKSKHVLDNCNMHQEGILKSYIKLPDGYHDMYMFSIINDKK